MLVEAADIESKLCRGPTSHANFAQSRGSPVVLMLGSPGVLMHLFTPCITCSYQGQCPQQKILIKLLRDLDQNIDNNGQEPKFLAMMIKILHKKYFSFSRTISVKIIGNDCNWSDYINIETYPTKSHNTYFIKNSWLRSGPSWSRSNNRGQGSCWNLDKRPWI